MLCNRPSMLPLRLFAILMAILVATQGGERRHGNPQVRETATPQQMTGASFHLRAGSVSLSISGGRGPAILF